ncbi:phage tail protein [Fusobacterium massiliense]|uniref:phage tail protein n=1 Tax=Fusobacterium massiliense TaxID=1852365 RepID=UPI000A4AF76F|nr:phage tail protein [Fusobacterium massiliense]
MADFNSHIITNAGRNLLARALAGEGKVLFTKAAFGDQKHSGNLREVTELKNKKLDLNVMNITNDNGTAVLTVQISNENVEQSFQTEEFGVYAKIEGDITEILYSYATAVSADTFPNNRLGKTYESIQDIYMAISSDIEAEIYVRDSIIYLTRDIANQVYTETGLTAVGTLKGRNNLEADKQYLADNGHWYKNIGGNRTWEATSGTPDEQLIPITWKYLYESLNNKENQLIQNLNGILGENNGEFPVEQAVAGNVYYFPRNQKYYYCLKSQTSRVSVPNADFEELSIYQNRKKLENLIKIKSYSIITQDSLVIQNGILVFSEIVISNFKNKIGIPSNSTIVSISAAQTSGYCEYVTYNYESDTAAIGHIVPSSNPRNATINVAYI